jgi:hypothetical protein
MRARRARRETAMQKVDVLYKWLAGLNSPDADLIVAAALEHAEAEYLPRLAALLLNRRRDTAWAGLLANHERLGPDVRAQLLADEPLRRAALAAALRGHSSRIRASVLTYLGQHPCAAVSYHVADALRDSSQRVRELAAWVLRCTASTILAASGEALEPAQAAQLAADRTALVAALRQTLRTFELHHRTEVLEICLWFTRDLGPSLWESLSLKRAHSAYVVRETLELWNNPRLAAFLLLALDQPAWRTQALSMLRAWRHPAHALAMLAESDLLTQPGVRDNLRAVDGYAWLSALGPSLNTAPVALQAQVPRWICALGFGEPERFQLLSCCLASPVNEVRTATVTALLQLNTAAARAVLVDAAAQPGPVGEFVRREMKSALASTAEPASGGWR